jgi:chromosome segregation ATPase
MKNEFQQLSNDYEIDMRKNNQQLHEHQKERLLAQKLIESKQEKIKKLHSLLGEFKNQVDEFDRFENLTNQQFEKLKAKVEHYRALW